MKLQNKSKRSYVHSYLDENYKLVLLQLKPNEVKEIPNDIAKVWLKSGEVVQFVEPQEVKNLENENAKLKAELEALKKAQPEEKVEEKSEEKAEEKETKQKSQSSKSKKEEK